MDVRRSALKSGFFMAAGACVLVAAWATHDRTPVPAAAGTADSAASASRATILVRLPSGTTTDQAQPFHLDATMVRTAMRDGELRVALPDGTTYPVRMERQSIDHDGHWNVVGRVQTTAGPQAMVLTFGGDAVFGVLPMPDGRQMQITTSRGRTTIAPAGGLVPRGAAGANVVNDAVVLGADAAPASATSAISSVPTSAPGPRTALLGPVPTDPVDITVLAVYGSDMVALRGSAATVETEIANMLAIATQAHIDSGSRVRLVLVDAQQAAPAYTSNGQALVQVAQDPSITALRDASSADLVTLVRLPGAVDDTCGTATLAAASMARNEIYERNAFSVVNPAPCGPYAMAHELGHNLGNAHDRESEYTPQGELKHGVYYFSFGFRRTVAPTFATIMSDPGTLPWIGRFSNPASSACGAPCGVADVADNVRSMNLVAAEIAAFRGAPGTVSIGDAVAYEGISGTSDVVLRVPVRFTAPRDTFAQVSVEVVGGTATADEDFILAGATVGNTSGERVVSLLVNGDETIEPDETVQLRLVNATGVTIERGEATATILNDDPRPAILGRLRFEGMPPPAGSVQITALGTSGNATEAAGAFAAPPDFAFRVPVVYGSSVKLWITTGTSRFSVPVWVNDVRKDRWVDGVNLQEGVPITSHVSGLDSGGTWMEWSWTLGDVLAGNGVNVLDSTSNQATFTAIPGARVRIEMTSITLGSYGVVLDDVRGAITHDFAISKTPSAYIDAPRSIREGNGETRVAGFDVRLPGVSLEAPAQVRYRTVDGTAKAGLDYVATSGTASFQVPSGNIVRVPVTILGDRLPERGEWFELVIDQPVGAKITTSRLKMEITDDDLVTGGSARNDSQ